jgi:hypothetical protein
VKEPNSTIVMPLSQRLFILTISPVDRSPKRKGGLMVITKGEPNTKSSKV